MMTSAGSTWAGTYEFTATGVHQPRGLDELRRLVARSPRIRAVGTRHSFNDIADTIGALVSLVGLDPEPRLDTRRMTVSVAAGTRYGVLAGWLQSRGYALHNMGSLPHISVGGATATATHGSGNTNGNLATAVSGLQLVTGGGELLEVDRTHPDFSGLVVGLGAFGITTRVTLDIEPTFNVRQDVYGGLSWAVMLAEFEAITSSAYSVSLFTNWLGDDIGALWLKTRLESGEPSTMPSEIFGARLTGPPQHSVVEGPDNMTRMDGTAGPWSERLPHFRLDSTPSNGDEIQSEYFVDRRRAAEALSAVRDLRDRIAPHLLTTELRTVAEDDLWLSTANGRPTLGIHFTWNNDPQAIWALLPHIEAALEPFDMRPHWGKWNTLDASRIVPLYTRLPEFVALANRLDPQHQFRNAYLERVLEM